MAIRQQIIDAFKSEFKCLTDKFHIVDGSAGTKPLGNPNKPGVYIFYKGDEVWKIGKSNTDAYVRSQQHFRDDTGRNIGFGMKQYGQDEDMKLLLFLLPDDAAVHWVYALEHFLEIYFTRSKNLKIPSKHR